MGRLVLSIFLSYERLIKLALDEVKCMSMRTLNKSADLVSEGGAVAAAEILGNINPESRAPADGVLRLGTLLLTDLIYFLAIIVF